MSTTLKRLALLVVAGFAGVLMLASPAAAAGPTITLIDDGFGGCTKPPNGAWTSHGAYSHMHIEDQLYWNSKTSLHINYSNARGELSDCGFGGRLVTGGSLRMNDSWRVYGIRISSCNIGVGTGCTIENGTVASSSFTTGTVGNSTGQSVKNGGGWNVYAQATGTIDQYVHDADITFSYGTYSTQAGTSNAANRNV